MKLGSKSAAVLVLGDLNRSPRMLNHCKAISNTMKEINEISLIGFQGGDLRSDISMDRKIKVHYIPEKINNYLKKLPRVFFLLSALIRILFQIIFLIYILLFKIPKPEFLILQNPPGIPAIYICSVVCFLRRSKLVIDWHNYGYTILEVNKRNKIIVKLAKFYEKLYSQCGYLHFCVSDAMKRHLKAEMGVEAVTLPDRAIKNVFQTLCLRESHELFKRYEVTRNILTMEDENRVVRWKPNRPILMLSSTSWTPDEDFDLLLESFIKAEQRLVERVESWSIHLAVPKRVLFLITGRGPMKDAFMKKVDEADLRVFMVRSIWLDSDDYPKLLGSADLGVCLHYSSSGFDLPMKVVDMFSAGLPVAAYYYETILELVQHGVNGFLFRNPDELADIFVKVVEDYTKGDHLENVESEIHTHVPTPCEDLNKFRHNLRDFGKFDWVTQWEQVACPEVVNLIAAEKKKTKLR